MNLNIYIYVHVYIGRDRISRAGDAHSNPRIRNTSMISFLVVKSSFQTRCNVILSTASASAFGSAGELFASGSGSREQSRVVGRDGMPTTKKSMSSIANFVVFEENLLGSKIILDSARPASDLGRQCDNMEWQVLHKQALELAEKMKKEGRVTGNAFSLYALVPSNASKFPFNVHGDLFLVGEGSELMSFVI